MKSLGRTIDRLIKVDPTLGQDLLPLKAKWKKAPARAMNYWRELLGYLNSPPLQEHPKRGEMKDIVAGSPARTSRVAYTFDTVGQGDKVVGMIPGNLADTIRRQDLASIRLAKGQVEANMTRNAGLMARLAREEAVIEIGMRRVWVALKDHFGLWDKTATYTIKRGPGELVLVEVPPSPPQQRSMMFPINPDMLRGLFGPPPAEE